MNHPESFFAKINRRKPSLTVRRMPSSIWRLTVVLLSPVMAQNCATENVTGDNGSLGSRGRRGLAGIREAHVVDLATRSRGFFSSVNSLLSLMGGHALESRSGLSGHDRFADPKPPLPQVGLNLHDGKFHAPAVHDLAGGDATFTSSSANSLNRILRAVASLVSNSRLQ
jgi:hypothetical protein